MEGSQTGKALGWILDRLDKWLSEGYRRESNISYQRKQLVITLLPILAAIVVLYYNSTFFLAGNFHLILTGLVQIPILFVGWVAVRWAQKTRPDVAFVFMSGMMASLVLVAVYSGQGTIFRTHYYLLAFAMIAPLLIPLESWPKIVALSAIELTVFQLLELYPVAPHPSIGQLSPDLVSFLVISLHVSIVFAILFTCAISEAFSLLLEIRLSTTQQKLVASEKMAALGVFTAGMAHEINNPANFVAAGAQNAEAQLGKFKGFVGELLDDEAPDEIKGEFGQHFAKLGDSLSVIRTGITRIENVVKHLRATHPEGDVGMQPADVVESLESAWRVLSPTVKTPIVLSTQLDARPQVSCMIAEINQVFLALLSNAAHAIEDALAVNGPDYKGEIKLASHEADGKLVITVSDNGIGIPVDKIDKVFDPFFTTKTVGRGAGLGLSMARDVVKKHGGTLEVESAEGQGARFTLALPLGASVD